MLNTINESGARGSGHYISRLHTRSFVLFSLLWIGICLIVLFPPVRDLIISVLVFVKSTILHRSSPFDQQKWHGWLSGIGFYGIVIYCVAWFAVFQGFFIPKVYADKIQIVLAFFAAAFFVFVIMFQANWSFSDDHEYITTTAVNKYISSFHGGGRFYPLRYIHFNLPLLVFRCMGIHTGLPVEAHFASIAILFSVLFFSLYKLFNRIGTSNSGTHLPQTILFVGTFFLLSSGFLSVFLDIIYPETLVTMLFSLFMLMYHKALETDKKRYYIFAFLSVAYSTYSKEPVFGTFLIFAFINHLFRNKKESKHEKLFYLALAANGIFYVVLYYFLSYKNVSSFYNEGRVVERGIELLVSILRGSPILLVMLVCACVRLWHILFKKDREHLFYDSLLFAGIGYTLAYFMLHLNSDYYFTPAVILFLPSLVYWTRRLFEKRYVIALLVLFLLMPVCVYRMMQTARVVTGAWKARGQFLPYIDTLLAEHRAGKIFVWYESDNGINENIFYRDVRNWKKHVENDFLNYSNKSEQREFFTVWKNFDTVDLTQNFLFFYPVDNDQYQPMAKTLADTLETNNFELCTDAYGVLIFKHRKSSAVFNSLPAN